MKTYRVSAQKRLLGFILSFMLIIGVVPAGSYAAGTDSFVLVVETKAGVVIAPEYISYREGQSIGEALSNSGHEFTGMEAGWITAIDGVVGNYSRSDEAGDADLGKSASEINFFRISEDEDSTPSAGIQQLMLAMADYQTKAADIKAAAKTEYDTAYEQFVGLDSDSAEFLAKALTGAFSDYESAQNGTKHQVTFINGSEIHQDANIFIENSYGKVWSDDGDGVMELPSGDYQFSLDKDGLRVEGNIAVESNMTVNAELPSELWLKTDSFRLSGSYEDANTGYSFSDDEYQLSVWNSRGVETAVTDTFTGKIYTYAEYDESMLDSTPTLTAIYTSARTGEEVQTEIPFESKVSGISNVMQKGAAGNSVIYRISTEKNDGYTYSQDYTVSFGRIPTLQNISVKDQNGVAQAASTAFDANESDYAYKVTDDVTAVTIDAVPLDEDYTVSINGEAAGNIVTVPVDGDTEIPVVVTAGEYSSTYNLTICPGEGLNLSFVTDRSDVTLEVTNKNGEILPYAKFKEGTTGNRYQYTLVPGETYNYIATCKTYYHVTDQFTMEDVAGSTINVDVPTEDWLSDLAFGLKSSQKAGLALNETFDAANHEYSVRLADTVHIPYVWVTAEEDAQAVAVYEQKFNSALYHGKTKSIELTSGQTGGEKLNRFLMSENPVENTVTIRLSKQIDGITCYQDYAVEFQRELTLQDISAESEGMTATLIQPDEKTGFDPAVKEYSVKVSMAAKSMTLSVLRYTDNLCYGEEEVGYRVKVDGEDITGQDSVEIPLDGTLATQKVTITVENSKALSGTADYVINVLKSPPVNAYFNITPGSALLAMYETMSGERVWPGENGSFQLCEGYSYDYALTAYGYVGKTGTLTVTRDGDNALVVTDGENIYAVTESAAGGGELTLDWTLDTAAENSTIPEDLDSVWDSFRGNEYNNGVTDAAIPESAEKGTLYWANKLGSGYSSDAVGSPILVDGDIITYSGSKIYRVDTITGKVKVTGEMDHKSAHATTPPSYSEGMIFVALTDGTVQAFNAETLESLWIYKDPLGGQPVCPITIKNGYLYTGFWNSETGDANFVCLSVTDEKPEQTKEQKSASWYNTAAGGYYWAGAYVGKDYVLIGTDDGTTSCTGQSSQLLMFDPKTGKLLDKWSGLNGDIRSSIVYDSATDAYYFTSKGGSFYSVKVTASGGIWSFAEKWSIRLENGTESTPMSTCSPSVYNGRAYVGVSGAGQFASYSGHNISVIDLKEKCVAYRVDTQGYPQTSGLLTTAYEKESGYVYVYFFDNMTPGKLRVLRDKAGQTKADYVTTENGYTTAYEVFTPTGEQAQYAICSPIVDEYGTIYFKNDSAHMMAFGSKIEKISVEKNPDKMVYKDGETFDPSGMVVMATYSNGKMRDVTEYVKFDVDKVTANNTEITISFPYVMYHNQENGTGMTSGITTSTPVTMLNVSIGEADEHIGHTPITIAGKAATCTDDGLTDGKKCSICGTIIEEQDTIAGIKSLVLSYTKKNYTGKSIAAPVLTIKDRNGKALVNGTDYDVTGLSNKKNVGRYKVTVTFKGKYAGTENLYFTIAPKAPEKVTAELYGYNDVQVTWKKVTGASGYAVYYKKYGASKYTHLANTNKNYVKKANLKDGTRYYFKVVPYYTYGTTKYTSLSYKTDDIYTLKQLNKPVLSKSGSKVKVKWNNISGETGYQISKSAKKNGTSIAATYKTTKGKYKLVKATKGKTYYYKVRAYKKVSINGKSKTIYGPWSSVKSYKRR